MNDKPTNPFSTQARLDGSLFVREDAMPTSAQLIQTLKGAGIPAVQHSSGVQARMKVAGRVDDFVVNVGGFADGGAWAQAGEGGRTVKTTLQGLAAAVKSIASKAAANKKL